MTHRPVLIVEDDPDIREVLAGMLDDAGHPTLTAATGRAALTLVQAMDAPPALILADLHVPGLSGLPLLDALRAITAPTETPVVVLSGSADFDSADHEDLGVVAHLQKPIDLDALLALVERWAT